MQTSPRRFGLAALVVLVLVGAGTWWSRGHESVIDSGKRPAQEKPQASTKHRAPNVAPAVPVVTDSLALVRCQRAWVEAQLPAWRQLGEQRDPASLLTHALLADLLNATERTRVLGDRSTHDLLAAASAAAPDDPEIAWYRMVHCARRGPCDRQRALDRVLAAEPDNLAGWLQAMSNAQSRHDGEALRTAIEGASRATYYDARDREAFLRIYSVMRETPLPAECAGGFKRVG